MAKANTHSRMSLGDRIFDSINVVLLGLLALIIMRTYFQTSIPYELQEAADIDGCSPFGVLIRIILPLSGPILTVIGLYYGVGHWNSYFSALLYDTIPTTTDELLEYFRATAAYDYNENGQADEIALSAGSIDDVMYLFMGSYGLMNRGSSHRDVYVDDDGELQYAYSSERFKEELRYLNQLYTEGLLDPDIFTIDFAQLIAKASTGRVGTYIFVNNSPVSNTEYEQYTLGFTEPFEGPQGYKTYGYYSIPASSNAQFMITYRCAEKGEDAVKAAVRWMDYWYSEEGIIRYFMGVEGVTYEEDADSPGGLKLTDYVLNNPDGISFEEVLAEYVPWAGGANPSVATNEYFKGGETWPVCLAAAEGLINYVPEIVWPPFSSVYSAEDATEMASIKTEQENYMKEWRAYFITGQRDIDADWDEYVAGYDGMNTARYMELYRAAREAMGVE